jgi:hypothetical protein
MGVMGGTAGAGLLEPVAVGQVGLGLDAELLRTPTGATRYRHRAALVEPVHAHLKDRRGLRRFTRRGLTAARSEYRFAAAVTNLLRLHTQLATNPT